MAEKDKPNLLVVKSIRLKGRHVDAGSVIPKTSFDNKGDWLDLVHMSDPILEETDDPVGSTSKSKSKKKSDAESTLPGVVA